MSVSIRYLTTLVLLASLLNLVVLQPAAAQGQNDEAQLVVPEERIDAWVRLIESQPNADFVVGMTDGRDYIGKVMPAEAGIQIIKKEFQSLTSREKRNHYISWYEVQSIKIFNKEMRENRTMIRVLIGMAIATGVIAVWYLWGMSQGT